MGYKTEINYIVKSSNSIDFEKLYKNELFINRNNIYRIDLKEKVLNENLLFSIEKDGSRCYMLDCPLFFANDQWDVLGMCIIIAAENISGKTKLTCKILDLYTEEYSKIVSEMIQDGESQLKLYK